MLSVQYDKFATIHYSILNIFVDHICLSIRFRTDAIGTLFFLVCEKAIEYIFYFERVKRQLNEFCYNLIKFASVFRASTALCIFLFPLMVIISIIYRYFFMRPIPFIFFTPLFWCINASEFGWMAKRSRRWLCVTFSWISLYSVMFCNVQAFR